METLRLNIRILEIAYGILLEALLLAYGDLYTIGLDSARNMNHESQHFSTNRLGRLDKIHTFLVSAFKIPHTPR